MDAKNIIIGNVNKSFGLEERVALKICLQRQIYQTAD